MIQKRNDTPLVDEQTAAVTVMPLGRRVLLAAGLTVWTAVGLYAASLLIELVVTALYKSDLLPGLFEGPVFATTIAFAVYALAVALVVGVPLKLLRHRTTKAELGLTRLPNWMDIGLMPVGFIVYMLLAGILLAVVTGLFPGFDADEAQEVGFENLSHYYEYILAFVTLVVLAPIAEELLVRGYLYGKLRKVLPVAGAAVLSALLFSFLHIGFTDADGNFAIVGLNVALNVLPLGIVLAVLRETTGSIWASVLLHMMKNGVAFYFLFVNPTLIQTIGG